MEIGFTKYAILVGIDDYKENHQSRYNLKPLKGCVKDIKKIKEVLINKCNFKEKNIYSIESTTEKSEIEIRNKIEIYLEEIGKTFEKNKDSIYFQFSGHGILDEGDSYVMLHNSPMKVIEIPEIVNRSLYPKHQFYTFDCCQCGGETTFIRGADSELQKLEKFFQKSSGLDILYACKKNQAALETENGGKLTNSIVKIISDIDYYDKKDGLLSSGMLIEQVKKEMIDEKQEPIGCSQTNGCYPFASKLFWKDIDMTNKTIEKEEDKRTMVENTEKKVDSIFSNKEKYYSDRKKMSQNLLELIEEIINNSLTLKENELNERKIYKDLLPRIYNSLDYVPISSGLTRTVKEENNKNLFGLYHQVGMILNPKVDEYEYTLGHDSFQYMIEYSLKNEFINSFKLGIVILPLKFGLSITFILIDSSFGSNTESILLENLYISVMTNEEFEIKKDNIKLMFEGKVEEFLNRNIEKNKIFNKELREELKEFETSVIKF